MKDKRFTYEKTQGGYYLFYEGMLVGYFDKVSLCREAASKCPPDFDPNDHEQLRTFKLATQQVWEDDQNKKLIAKWKKSVRLGEMSRDDKARLWVRLTDGFKEMLEKYRKST